MKRKIIVAVMSLVAAPLLAQTYPNKPIRLLSTIAGGSEALHRAMATRVGEAMGQPIIFETQPAANGMVAAEATARAAPDGYTILIAVPGSMVVRGFLTKVMPYQPVKDFTPITMAALSIGSISTHAASPVNSLKELIDTSRASSRKLTYSTNGIGSSDHLTGELVNQLSNAGLLHIPHKSQGQAVTAAVAGEVDAYMGVLSGTMPLINAGKLKVLAYTNARPPINADPKIPLIRDVLPAFENPLYWVGYFGPAGLPQPVLRRLNGEYVKALTSPEFRPKFEAQYNPVVANSPEEFTAMLNTYLERVAQIVRAAGIKPE
ncbi:MAG: tripartite tricarboxylate transporter substrate binding protein [Betaproteobacteria bacterium]|nr:tripartite tricarboxylate transporter substrate binding protein [Betaproteobacteria bacterium]